MPKGIKEVNWTLTVWLSFFLGWLGVDRFIMGKVGTGILKLITFGGLGIWWLIDLIMIMSSYKFKNIAWKFPKNKTVHIVIICVLLVTGIISGFSGSDEGITTSKDVIHEEKEQLTDLNEPAENVLVSQHPKEEAPKKFPTLGDSVIKKHSVSERISIKLNNVFYTTLSLELSHPKDLVREDTPEDIKKELIDAYNIQKYYFRYDREKRLEASEIIKKYANYSKYERTFFTFKLTNEDDSGHLNEFDFRLYVYDPSSKLLLQEGDEYATSLDPEQLLTYGRGVRKNFENVTQDIYVILNTYFNSQEIRGGSIFKYCKKEKKDELPDLFPRILGEYDCDLEKMKDDEYLAVFKINPSRITKQP